MTRHSTLGALLPTLAFVGACALSNVQQAGYVDPVTRYAVVRLHFEERDDAPAISAELRHRVADTFAASGIADRIVRHEGGEADADAYFALRAESGEIALDLLPWPALSARNETRYRIRIVDRASGRVVADADRSLLRHGAFAFSRPDAGAVAEDLARVLDASTRAVR